MKLYTIIGGVNGCGKSSLTGALKAERSDLGTVLDGDRPSTIDECLEKGISFTQETTLSGARTERTIRRAKDLGYTIRLYYIGLDTVEESLGRIRNRVAKGGHNIPREDVERRFSTRFADVLRVLPYCDEARFFDNDNGFVEVAEYRNGELFPRVADPPRWLRELQNKMA